jgi:DNA modification methylase
MTIRLLVGDCRDVLRTLPDESVHCVVCSPPYWGLRDYGNAQFGIGLEETVDEHVAALVGVFREVRRVLRSDGTLWVNYGDAYAGSWGAQGRGDKRSEMEIGDRIEGHRRKTLSEQQIIAHPKRAQTGSRKRTGCKAKDLIGLPWMLAFALRADGWWLRQDIIWSKPNPMPESVTDRCTKAHEYVFMLSKSEHYHYDQEAIKEPSTWDPGNTKMPDGWDTAASGHGTFHRNGREKGAPKRTDKQRGHSRRHAGFNDRWDAMERSEQCAGNRNKRSVWTIATAPFAEAHFATFPPALIEPCILAGCPEGGTVLDPFGGAGTTGLVADRLKRSAILIELNPDYAAMAERRIANDAPLFSDVARQSWDEMWAKPFEKTGDAE